MSRAGLALAGLALVTGCDGGEAREDAGAAPVVVDAVVALEDTIRVRIRSVGSLEADQRVQMSAEAAGRVSEVLFAEGQTVRRGDVLLRLNAQKLDAEVEAGRAAVARAEHEAANLERQLERNRGLLEVGAISEQAFDDLQTQVEAASSRLEEARAQLSLVRSRLADATIRAPFGGRVGAREVDPGTYVAAGDPLFLLVDNDPLEITFTVPERYLRSLDVGDPVELAVSSFPDRSFTGEVSFVSPVVDARNRTVTMKADIPNPREELRAGQFANVILELEARPGAVVIPEQAVVPIGGERFVFVVREGAAMRRPVELGERSGGRVEVTSGVAAGDTVIVAGQQRVADGSPVAPRLQEMDALELGGGAPSAGPGAADGVDDGGAAADAPRAGQGADGQTAEGPAAGPADDGG